MKVYVGIKNGKATIIESDADPNKEAQPPYDIIYGPFKSGQDAERYVKAMGGLACGEG